MKTLVTGATGGIGSATVRLLLQCNAKVVATGRNYRRIEEKYHGNSNVLSLQADFANEDDARDAVQHTLQHFGRLDYVIHCAGAVVSGRLDRTPLVEWNSII